MKAFRPENSIKRWAERTVIVMDQEPERLFSTRKFPNQLAGLFSHPDLIGIGDDTSKMNLARAQFDEEKHVNGLQQDGFYGEKITSKNLIFVVGYENTCVGYLTRPRGFGLILDWFSPAGQLNPEFGSE